MEESDRRTPGQPWPIRHAGRVLAGTAIGKTRAEATQLAEGKLEEIRARQPPATKPVSSPAAETLTGVNATFSRSWPMASAGLTGLDLDRVMVCVTWGDPCGGRGERKVAIDSLLAWTNIGTSGSVGSGPSGAGGGGADGWNGWID